MPPSTTAISAAASLRLDSRHRLRRDRVAVDIGQGVWRRTGHCDPLGKLVSTGGRHDRQEDVGLQDQPGIAPQILDSGLACAVSALFAAPLEIGDDA